MLTKHFLNRFRLFIIAILPMVSSCSTLNTLTYSKDEASGVTGQSTRVALLGVPAKSQPVLAGELPAGLQAELPAILAGCGAERAEAFPILIPLIGFALEQGVSAGIDAVAGRAKSIQDNSQKTYSSNLIVEDPGSFSQAKCLMIVREAVAAGGSGAPGGKGHVGLLAIFGIVPHGTTTDLAFNLEPRLVYLGDAVAWTKAGQPMDLAFAFVGRAVRLKDGVPTVQVFTQETISVADVGLGKVVRPRNATGLLTRPSKDAGALEIAVAVTETGDGAPDAARVKAELTALDKAVRPKIIEQITSQLAPAPG